MIFKNHNNYFVFCVALLGKIIYLIKGKYVADESDNNNNVNLNHKVMPQEKCRIKSGDFNIVKKVKRITISN